MDIEKTYHHVNWDFLFVVMSKNGVWTKVDKIDKMLYLYNKLFCSH